MTLDLALADRVHGNLIEVNSWMGEGPGGSLLRHDGELCFAGRSTLPFLNGVLRARSAADADGMLERAREFFFSRSRGFVTYAWPGDPAVERAATAAGMFPVLERYPQMVCRAPLAELPAQLRSVETVADAEAYWAVCEAAYPSLGFPAGVFAEAFDAETLLDPRVHACMAEVDGRAAACASLWSAAGVGYVGWVASTPEARGGGLAAACTVAVTNHAFARGHEIVSLQASSMGEDLYRRLGYEDIFAYRLLAAAPA